MKVNYILYFNLLLLLLLSGCSRYDPWEWGGANPESITCIAPDNFGFQHVLLKNENIWVNKNHWNKEVSIPSNANVAVVVKGYKPNDAGPNVEMKINNNEVIAIGDRFEDNLYDFFSEGSREKVSGYFFKAQTGPNKEIKLSFSGPSNTIVEIRHPGHSGTFLDTIQSDVRGIIFGSSEDGQFNSGVMQAAFLNIVSNSSYKIAVHTILVLYIVISFLLFLMGSIELTKSELIARTIKIIIVSQLLTEDRALSFFYDNFFMFFIDGFNALESIIGRSSIGELVNIVIYGNLYPKVSSVDFGFLLFIFLVLPIIVLLLYGLFEATYKVIVASIGIAILITLFPIFLCFILFDFTKDFFEQWLKKMISYSFQVIILLFGLSFITTSIADRVYTAFGFPVCFNYDKSLALFFWFPKDLSGGFNENIRIPYSFVDDKSQCLPYGCKGKRDPNLPYLDPNNEQHKELLDKLHKGAYVGEILVSTSWSIFFLSLLLILNNIFALKIGEILVGGAILGSVPSFLGAMQGVLTGLGSVAGLVKGAFVTAGMRAYSRGRRSFTVVPVLSDMVRGGIEGAYHGVFDNTRRRLRATDRSSALHGKLLMKMLTGKEFSLQESLEYSLTKLDREGLEKLQKKNPNDLKLRRLVAEYDKFYGGKDTVRKANAELQEVNRDEARVEVRRRQEELEVLAGKLEGLAGKNAIILGKPPPLPPSGSGGALPPLPQAAVPPLPPQKQLIEKSQHLIQEQLKEARAELAMQQAKLDFEKNKSDSDWTIFAKKKEDRQVEKAKRISNLESEIKRAQKEVHDIQGLSDKIQTGNVLNKINSAITIVGGKELLKANTLKEEAKEAEEEKLRLENDNSGLKLLFTEEDDGAENVRVEVARLEEAREAAERLREEARAAEEALLSNPALQLLNRIQQESLAAAEQRVAESEAEVGLLQERLKDLETQIIEQQDKPQVEGEIARIRDELHDAERRLNEAQAAAEPDQEVEADLSFYTARGEDSFLEVGGDQEEAAGEGGGDQKGGGISDKVEAAMKAGEFVSALNSVSNFIKLFKK